MFPRPLRVEIVILLLLKLLILTVLYMLFFQHKLEFSDRQMREHIVSASEGENHGSR